MITLSLGDSFAAGYRVGQDQTYSARLEASLDKEGIKTQVPIAMIEEPTSALYYFQEHATKLKPTMVLFGLTLGNDITQALYYSQKKYQINQETGQISPLPFVFDDFWKNELSSYEIPSHCLTSHKTPYARPAQNARSFSVLLDRLLRLLEADRGEAIASYLVPDEFKPRLFDASAGLGHFLKSPSPIIEESFARLFVILAALKKQAEKNHTDLVILLFPQRFQVQPPDWTETARAYGLRPDCFDLEAPNKKILNFCAAAKLTCFDALDSLRAHYTAHRRSLYFPNGDMHWNEEGHGVVATALQPLVASRLSRSSKEK